MRLKHGRREKAGNVPRVSDGQGAIGKILAWQPLPEPYKEDN